MEDHASVAASCVPWDPSSGLAWAASEAFGASFPLGRVPAVDRIGRLEVAEASLDHPAYLACPSEARGSVEVVAEDHFGDP